MPEPHTTPGEHDVPVFQPGKPTPDDPRKEAPMKDPPADPEHDIDEPEPIRQAGGRQNLDPEPPEEPSPDRMIYDESRVPG